MIQIRRMMSDSQRLAAFKAGFDHAELVIRAVLLPVSIAEMDLQTRDPITESAQRALQHFLEPRR